MKGVDISHYQKGLTISQIKDAGCDFAIIKLTEGNFLIDSAAFCFYHEAFTMGFPVGCYCYSYATTAEQARREAEFLLKTLNGFPMPCGIFLDVEEPKQLGLGYEQIMAVLTTWCDAIKAAGYIPGVYSSEYNLWAKISPADLSTDTLVWVAHYGKEPDVACDLWQSSDSGKIGGVTVDTDEVRSSFFEALALKGFKAQEPDKPPDACPIDGPCDSQLDLIAEFLRTDACRELFKAFIAGKENQK